MQEMLRTIIIILDVLGNYLTQVANVCQPPSKSYTIVGGSGRRIQGLVCLLSTFLLNQLKFRILEQSGHNVGTRGTLEKTKLAS